MMSRAEIVPPCDLRVPEGDAYYLVIHVDKDGNVSSYGRDSENRERPAGPSPCP